MTEHDQPNGQDREQEEQEEQEDGPRSILLTRSARSLFARLSRCGGTMRMAPLARGSGLDRLALVAVINELLDRCWVRIVWRKSAAGVREDTGRYSDIERLIATKFGKYRYSVTWETRD